MDTLLLSIFHGVIRALIEPAIECSVGVFEGEEEGCFQKKHYKIWTINTPL